MPAPATDRRAGPTKARRPRRNACRRGGKTQVKQDGEPRRACRTSTTSPSDSQQTPDERSSRRASAGRRTKMSTRGMVDTDRAPVTDQVYNDKVKR